MTYCVVFKRSVLKDIRRIPSAILDRLQVALRALQNDPFPSGSIRLHTEGSFYRIRIGSYRIVYEVAREIRIITIIRIGHRRNVYTDF